MGRTPAPLLGILAALAALALATGAAAVTVTGLTALHHDGQTFLTWTSPPGTGWAYRVYASPTPLLVSADLDQATLVSAVGDSTWCDRRLYVLLGQPVAYHIDSLAPALTPDRGLCVVTPLASGATCYAVTVGTLAGPEDRTLVPGDNTLAAPVVETLATPRPVFQFVLPLSPSIQPAIYTLWVTHVSTPLFPAMMNRPGGAFDCGVRAGGAAPDNSLLFSLHSRQASFLNGVYSTGHPGEWVLAPDDPLPTRDVNSFWYGYHESYDLTMPLNPTPTSGEVCDYTDRRLLFTLRWALRNFGIDSTRVYEYGFSMGAIGGFYFALHHPTVIAAQMSINGLADFSFTGDPNPQCGTDPGNWLRQITDRLWGPVPNDLPTCNGGNAYEQLSGPAMVATLGDVAMPPLVAFNGKNDGTLGWAVNIPFYAAMRANHQGGLLFWDQRTHLSTLTSAWLPMTVPQYLYRFRTNVSFPAFSSCSADGDPGDGIPANGDTIGVINGLVDWDPAVLDAAGQWEVTLATRDLVTQWGPYPAPDSLTVDVTPRRLQAFHPVPLQTYQFQVTRLSDAAVIQSGQVAADATGLVTIPAVIVLRAGTRLHVQGPSGAVAVQPGAARAGPLRIRPVHNPFAGAAPLTLEVPRAGEVRADLVDVTGRVARGLYRGTCQPGALTLRLDAGGLPAGVYFIRARLDAERAERRVVLLR
jgi:hypothetical protein